MRIVITGSKGFIGTYVKKTSGNLEDFI